jgi:hypothetical protein
VEVRRSSSKAGAGKNIRPHMKNKVERDGGMAQVIE